MNLDNLRTAIALVRHGTVNRTAAAEGLAPSSVSDRVRRLEGELGERLFVRDRTGMRPTAAGRVYLTAARSALGDLDAAADRLAQAGSTVLVGAQASIADALLPGVLADLERRCPEIAIEVRPEPDRLRLLSALVRDEVHAIVLLDAGAEIGDLGYPAPPADLEYLDVRDVPMMTVSAPDHRLVGRPVRPEELRVDTTLVGQESRCSFWMATRRWLGPETELTAVGGLAQVREWVATGRGVAVLPDFAVRGDLESGRLAALDVLTPPLRLRLVWRSTVAQTQPVRSLLYALSRA